MLTSVDEAKLPVRGLLIDHVCLVQRLEEEANGMT